MKQIVLPGDLKGSARLVLDAKTAHYLIAVRRMRTGDSFEAMDSAGSRFACTILADDPRAAEISLSALPSASPGPNERPDSGLRIALVQALPKGQKFDLIVRQATELGTALIVPTITQYCVGAEPGDRSAAKLERRRRIIREALQQSGSEMQTEIAPTVDLADLEATLERHGFARGASVRVLFHEAGQRGARPLHEVLSGTSEAVVVAIGPEGGFSAADCATFEGMGFGLFHAEGPVLRVETAAIFAISAIRAIAMERDIWNR